jgi:hypothetical protein
LARPSREWPDLVRDDISRPAPASSGGERAVRVSLRRSVRRSLGSSRQGRPASRRTSHVPSSPSHPRGQEPATGQRIACEYGPLTVRRLTVSCVLLTEDQPSLSYSAEQKSRTQTLKAQRPISRLMPDVPRPHAQVLAGCGDEAARGHRRDTGAGADGGAGRPAQWQRRSPSASARRGAHPRRDGAHAAGAHSLAG